MWRTSYFALLAAITFTLLLTWPVLETQVTGGTIRKKLTLYPATEPQPALKYQLLPGFLDQTPGNAAEEYKRIIAEWQETKNDKLNDKLSDWHYMPLDELPRDEIREVLVKQKSILEKLDKAARCRSCIWKLPLRKIFLWEDPHIDTIMNHRHLAKLLLVKARLEVAEGKYEEAVITMQSGYAMAGHIAEAPLLINSLVGLAVAGMTTRVVEEMIAKPDSPNMYWALTNLPSSITSIRRAIATEKNFFYFMIPELRNVDKSPSTPEYWREMTDRIDEIVCIAIFQGYRYSEKQNTRSEWTTLTTRDYPRCKKATIAGGLKPELVEAMPKEQVVVTQSIREFDELYDDIVKWFGLPYWQVKDDLETADSQLYNLESCRGFNKVFRHLMLGIRNCKLASARAEREIALLRTIEALRLFAAGHDGQLPSRLNDIKTVPLPLDPITGETFIYRLDDETAIIEVSPSDKDMCDGKIIEIRIGR